MKFIFADSLDYIDPGFDFLNDQNSAGRKPYWDDQFPHEYLGYAPYDGLLVSRAMVGDSNYKGRYTESQAMRFRRVGARQFYRLEGPQFADMPIYGDSGAFQYVKQNIPPYTPEDMVEFYLDGGFTHGFSVDHIIFDFDSKLCTGLEGGSEEARRRYDLTLHLAERFLAECSSQKVRFKPIGVIQGWSPGSMGEAARNLVKMGYDYIALGGLVPLSSSDIHIALQSVMVAIKDYHNVKLHLLGFAKSETLGEFKQYPITSFDTTSPLIRAFKDERVNYYLLNGTGLKYYTAIRIPQVDENLTLKRKIKIGLYKQEELRELEKKALQTTRDYDRGSATIDAALDAIMKYSYPLFWSEKASDATNNKTLNKYREAYLRTLSEQPWKSCLCKICSSLSVDCLIFRGSNRNKRRGIHNISIFYQHLKNIRGYI